MSVFDIATATGVDLETILRGMATGHLPWKFRDGHMVTTPDAVRRWKSEGRNR
jgi:hypothetical protein